MNREWLAEFQATILQWQGIEAVPHRFGGTEFKVGKVEIGHIHHGNGMVDIPFTVKIREVLVAESLAVPHHFLPDTGWISFYIRTEQDLQAAIRLMRLSYLHKTSRRQGIQAADIEALGLSPSLKALAFPSL